MFVIEKYGYLTNEEKNNLILDLKNQGFDIENLDIVAPNEQKSYGELLEFKLTYNLEQKLPTMNIGSITNQSKNIKLVIYKNSFSKR